jgi:hypothetical protein
MLDRTKIKLTKLDAAQRQLRTAIRLWFNGGDPVSIHTLAYAAYEIIHVLSKRHNPSRQPLIFDSLTVREEHRADFNIAVKEHANFFKHANKDWNDTIEFAPILTSAFLMGASAGIRLMGKRQTPEESALVLWISLHRPSWLSEPLRNRIENAIPIKDIRFMRAVPKSDFLEAFTMALKHAHHAGK